MGSTTGPPGATLPRGGLLKNRRVLGWVAFLGVIVLLNVLSHVFGWGFRFF